VLSTEPRTVATAARRLGLTRQSVQRVVDDLVEDGQLELHANPDHARAPLVSLTGAGRETLAAVVQNSDRNRGALMKRAQITAEELHAARRVLTRLLNGLRDQAT
jgi:DNA-binding MarR family transcriptional regulator